MNKKEKSPLSEYFRGEDKGNKWHLFCRKCGKGWALNKPTDGPGVHPGNLLHLLNHAHSHKQELQTRGVQSATGLVSEKDCNRED